MSGLRFISRSLLRCANNPARLRRAGELFFWLTGYRRETKTKRAKIAVVKLDRLGDLVLCSGMLATLRRARLQSHITLIVRESLAELAGLCPDVDEVIGVPVTE